MCRISVRITLVFTPKVDIPDCLIFFLQKVFPPWGKFAPMEPHWLPMGPMGGMAAAIWAAWAIKAGLAMAPCMAEADVTVDDAHGLGMGMAICWLLGRLDPVGLPPAACWACWRATTCCNCC